MSDLPPPDRSDTGREIGMGSLLALIRRRALWIAVAAALGAAVGAAYMLVSSSAARDPLAGAAVGLVVGTLIAGWIEWAPRTRGGLRTPALRPTLRMIAGFTGGLAVGALVGVVAFDAVVGSSSSGDTRLTAAEQEEPEIESAVGADGTVDARDLRRCLNGEMSTTNGSFWAQIDPTEAEAVFVAGDRQIKRDDRDWDRPLPDSRATLFVYPDGKTARKARKAVEEAFAEVEFATRYTNVLVGLTTLLKPPIDRPLKACLGVEEWNNPGELE